MRYPWAKMAALAARSKSRFESSPKAAESLSQPEAAGELFPEARFARDLPEHIFPQRFVATLRRLMETGAHERACTLLELRAQTEGEDAPAVASWVIAARLYAAAESAARAGEESAALQHLRAALDRAGRGPQHLLHPRSLQRLESVWQLFQGQAEQALANYPYEGPPGFPVERLCVERALIALAGRELSRDVEEQIRFDLAQLALAEHQGAFSPLAAGCLAALYARRSLWTEAVLWLERAQRQSAGDDPALGVGDWGVLQAYDRLATAFAGTSPRRALSLWRRALTMAHPSQSAVLLRRCAYAARDCALSDEERGGVESVIEEIAAAVDRIDAPHFFELSEVLMHAYVALGRYAHALTLCERLLVRRPGHTPSQVARALLLAVAGNAEAAYDLLVPLACDAAHPMAVRSLALAARAAGRTLESVRQQLRSLPAASGGRAVLKELGICWEASEGMEGEGAVAQRVRETLLDVIARSLAAYGRGDGSGAQTEPEGRPLGPPIPPLSWWLAAESAASGKFAALLNRGGAPRS